MRHHPLALATCVALVGLGCATGSEDFPPELLSLALDDAGSEPPRGNAGSSTGVSGSSSGGGSSSSGGSTSAQAGASSLGGSGNDDPDGGMAASAGESSVGGSGGAGGMAGAAAGGMGGSGGASGGSGGSGGSTGGGGSGGGGSGSGGSGAGCEAPAWVANTNYGIGAEVTSTCSGAFATQACPEGATHSFRCDAEAVEVPWCKERQPGVGNGWDVVWTDLGSCD